MSKCLVAPLNWGLGHASRCIPLIHRLLDEGHEVVIGGDGMSFTLLRKHFPKLRYVYLAPLDLHYSRSGNLTWTMLRAIPRLLLWRAKDRMMLKAILQEEHFDQVISDNRPGLHNEQVECIYITHQLRVKLTKTWRWAEAMASRIHARMYTRFNKVWVPDYEDINHSLAGELSHPAKWKQSRKMTAFQYIGPLSRFHSPTTNDQLPINYDVLAVLSGLEPQRTILEHELIERFSGKEERVLIVQGLVNHPNTRIKRGNLTIVPSMADAELVPALLNARHIIARSGYSTIMDLEALGLLSVGNNKPSPVHIELIPTPGQPEQEYLAVWLKDAIS